MRRRRELTEMTVVFRAAQAEKPRDVQTALDRIAPKPKQREAIEVDEYGDRVRGGWVVGWWEQAGDTA